MFSFYSSISLVNIAPFLCCRPPRSGHSHFAGFHPVPSLMIYLCEQLLWSDQKRWFISVSVANEFQCENRDQSYCQCYGNVLTPKAKRESFGVSKLEKFSWAKGWGAFLYREENGRTVNLKFVGSLRCSIFTAFLQLRFQITNYFLANLEIANCKIALCRCQCPRDSSLPAQPISIRKAHAVKKKVQKPLRISKKFLQKKCLPCLIIIQSRYFDYRIDKLLASSRCVICVSFSIHLILPYYVRKGS